jgi:nitrite reductase (NADH) small subunit
VTTELERVPVGPADSCPPGSSRIVVVAGIEVGIFNLDGRLVAYRNYCPHQGAPVCLGRIGGAPLPSEPATYIFGLENRVLRCPWHGWEFDLSTGHALVGGSGRLAKVRAEVEDGMIVLYVRRPNVTATADGS